MGTWADLLAACRSWLGDTTGKYADAKLFGYAQTAIRDMSLRLPNVARATLALTNRAALMPADWIGSNAMRVFYGSIELRQSESVRPSSGFYCLSEGALAVASDYASLDVLYQAGYEVPAAYDADEEVSVPEADWEPILWFVTALVFGEVAGKDAALQRWDEKGKRDDSPLIPEHRWRMIRYHDAVDIRRMARSAGTLRKR